jgi:hypothetical protein
VVERTFAWISKHRRTVRDCERLPAIRKDVASQVGCLLWATDDDASLAAG